MIICQSKPDEGVADRADLCRRFATKFVVSMNRSTQFLMHCSTEDPNLFPGEVTQKSKHSSVSSLTVAWNFCFCCSLCKDKTNENVINGMIYLNQAKIIFILFVWIASRLKFEKQKINSLPPGSRNLQAVIPYKHYFKVALQIYVL